MPVIFISITALFFLGMGVYALAAPAAVVRPFGIRLQDPAARYEVRAVYGGFGVAMAGILVFAATRDDSLRTGILVTVAVALAGMAVGRAVAAVLEERTSFYPNWVFFLVELVGAGLLLAVA
ncbi:DUF4345 domain-containing protein [Nocardia sp. 2]|uniref:DUF4345 domain-containing protein n=1 Tax=Nocardia acididurans TaxID=2802282 RepID=A0ABS1M9T5_9NOCA|nr:DUF4345 domain-containing protein [Nocardia acididurans]MBL1076524.1 DUF4345 domain-containing protein [Nocardia acididurans]